jgi:hypothetical protein
MNFVDFAIALGLAAAQAQGSPYFRGPPVVYVPPGYQTVQPMPPPAYRAPRPQPRALTQDQERDRVIDAGEAFCRKYPGDKMCHYKDQPVEPQQ